MMHEENQREKNQKNQKLSQGWQEVTELPTLGAICVVCAVCAGGMRAVSFMKGALNRAGRVAALRSKEGGGGGGGWRGAGDGDGGRMRREEEGGGRGRREKQGWRWRWRWDGDEGDGYGGSEGFKTGEGEGCCSRRPAGESKEVGQGGHCRRRPRVSREYPLETVLQHRQCHISNCRSNMPSVCQYASVSANHGGCSQQAAPRVVAPLCYCSGDWDNNKFHATSSGHWPPHI